MTDVSDWHLAYPSSGTISLSLLTFSERSALTVDPSSFSTGLLFPYEVRTLPSGQLLPVPLKKVPLVSLWHVCIASTSTLVF
jgi:hypothetical protein